MFLYYLRLKDYICLQDIASEHPERFFIAEIIREKIFMQYRNEVPYASQVSLAKFVAQRKNFKILCSTVAFILFLDSNMLPINSTGECG